MASGSLVICRPRTKTSLLSVMMVILHQRITIAALLDVAGSEIFEISITYTVRNCVPTSTVASKTYIVVSPENVHL